MRGDFNAIVKLSERKGSSNFNKRGETKEFMDFLGSNYLVDVPSLVNKFTWFSGDGRSMSKINRFLLSHALVDRRGMVNQVLGKRDLLDHCPIWIKVNSLN